MMRCFVIFLAICAFTNALRCEDASLVYKTRKIIGILDDELVLRNCTIENVTFAAINATIEMYNSIAVVDETLIVAYATRAAIFDANTFKMNADYLQLLRLHNRFIGYSPVIEDFPSLLFDLSAGRIPTRDYVAFTNNTFLVE